MFRIRDPDPHAVDARRILALRIEALSRGRFFRTYHVLFNRPYSSGNLRVHRHTLPAHMPLSGLAARWLPQHGKQDVIRFARAVRREIVAYHNRLGVVADAKRHAETAHEQSDDTDIVPIVDVRTADAEAKQVHVEWADGRTGRVELGEDGVVGRMVVLGPYGRTWSAGMDAKWVNGREVREVHGLLARMGVDLP